MENLIDVSSFHLENESIKIYFRYTGNHEIGPVKTKLVHKKTGLTIYQCFFNFSVSPHTTYWISTSQPDHKLSKLNDSTSHHLSSILGECTLEFQGGLNESHLLDFGGDGRAFFVLGKETLTSTLDEGFGTFLDVNVYQVYNSGPVSLIPGDVVLDVGANYGFFSLYALNHGAKRIISLEPSPPTYQCLLKNVGDFERIEPIQEAISDRDGVVRFSNSESSVLNHILSDASTEEGIDVITTSINSLIERYSLETIDFLKVDCEGSEMELFKSITDENLRKVNRTVIEYHSNHILNFVINRLESSGFKIYEVRGSSDVGLIYAYR